MAEDKGVKAHITIEKSRVWDLKSTGQVSSGVRSFAAISCVCFHPTDPTLCVVTVQGPLSVLSFYNAQSGGKMSTVPLRSVVAAAQFTRDGNQIVIVFRDWNVMLLRPGSPRWTRTLIPFKKEPKPTEQILLTLNPSPLPIIYFTSLGQSKLNVVLSEVAPSRGTILTSSHKNAFNIKLANVGILGLAAHHQDPDVLFVSCSDGTLQVFLLEQQNLKKLYSIGGETPVTTPGPFCQLVVLPHPFLHGSALILSTVGPKLDISVTQGRSEIVPVDQLTLKGFKKVTGLGIYRPFQLLLAFGESEDGKVKCYSTKITGSPTLGLKLVPVSTTIDSGATDTSSSQHSISGIINVAAKGSGSWMELWDAVPAWAQNPAQISQSRQKIRNVKIHDVMGSIAGQVSSSGMTGTGPHVLLWTIHDNSHPSGGSLNTLIVPQHTSLSFWNGIGTAEEYRLEFPHRCYYLNGNCLMGYGLKSKESAAVVPFSPPNGKAGPAKAESVVCSRIHRAWLVFFRSYSTEGDSNGVEEWTYTLQREDEVGASRPWFKPGVSGAFVGPKEDHFCVLDPDLFTVLLYPTKTVSGTQTASLSLALPAPGLLIPALFPGPPITQIPDPPAPPEFTQSGNLVEQVIEEEEETEVKLGYGVVIWVNKFRQIAMGSMLSHQDNSQRSRYEQDSIEPIQGGTFSELGDGEIIIQVAWQTLIEEQETTTQEPNSYTCVILTNQRFMLFLANGYPVLSFPPQSSPGMVSPPTSCLWIGPALLYVTQSGEVNQLLWDGTTVMICGAPSTSGAAFLVSALADRILFVCRDSELGTWQVSSRHAIIGFALLMGWATLASSGLMPPSWAYAHARSQMKTISQYFDLTTISAPLTKALVQSDFPDVARRIANRWTQQEAQQIKVACSVAACEWKEAAASLLLEHKNSIYHPRPIPKGSTLWTRFYSVALGAVHHGETEVAAELFSYAGEWEWALLFLSVSSAPSKASEILQRAEQYLDGAERSRIQSLAAELRKSNVQSSTESPIFGQKNTELGDLEDWNFASTGYVVPMLTVQGETPQGMIKAGDLGTIDPLETNDIKGYISGVSKKPTHGSFMRRSISSSISGRSLLNKPQQKSALDIPIPEVLEVGQQSQEESADPFTALQTTEELTKQNSTPKHKSAFSNISFDENFSSDEDALETTDLERGGFGKKFKIQIRKKEESHGGTSADALREAAKNLRLSKFGGLNPSLGPSGFANALKGGTLTRSESVSSMSSSTSNLEQKFGLSLAAGDASLDPFSIKPRLTGDSSSPSPLEAFQRGVKQMESGHWEDAIEEFSKEGVLSIPRGKQYLAAVLLLQTRVGLVDSDAARIDRFASALNLEEKHKKALVTQSVKQNMECGNYGYASERLSWLLNVSAGSTSSQFTSGMMQQLDECNRQGAKNQDISPFENLNSVPDKIENVMSVSEMKTVIDGLAS